MAIKRYFPFSFFIFFCVVGLLFCCFSLCTLLVVFMATINIKVFPCAHTHAYTRIGDKVGDSDLAGCLCVCFVCLA